MKNMQTQVYKKRKNAPRQKKRRLFAAFSFVFSDIPDKHPADIYFAIKAFPWELPSRKFRIHQPLQQQIRMQAITRIQMQLLLSKRLQRQFIYILPSPHTRLLAASFAYLIYIMREEILC